MKYVPFAFAAAMMLMLNSCMEPEVSKTGRTGVEQLILSQAADRALRTVDFRGLRDKRCFLDESKLIATDKEYLVSVLRNKIMMAGGIIEADVKNAQVLVEVTCGGFGTDQDVSIIGVPPLPLPVPYTSSTFVSPELSLWNMTEQTASCKLNIVVRDALTNKVMSIHPQRFGCSYFNRHAILMFFSWSTSSLGEDGNDMTVSDVMEQKHNGTPTYYAPELQ